MQAIFSFSAFLPLDLKQYSSPLTVIQVHLEAAEDVMEAKATAAILVCFHLLSESQNVVKKRKIFAFWSLIIKQKSATLYSNHDLVNQDLVS